MQLQAKIAVLWVGMGELDHFSSSTGAEKTPNWDFFKAGGSREWCWLVRFSDRVLDHLRHFTPDSCVVQQFMEVR